MVHDVYGLVSALDKGGLDASLLARPGLQFCIVRSASLGRLGLVLRVLVLCICLSPPLFPRLFDWLIQV
jgi:hypothetical protein